MIHIDHGTGQFQVVARPIPLHTRLSDDLDELVLGARRRRRVRQIRQRRECRLQPLLDLGKLAAQLLLARPHLALRGDRLARVLPRALGLRDRLDRRVALGPQPLQTRNQRASRAVQLEHELETRRQHPRRAAPAPRARARGLLGSA